MNLPALVPHSLTEMRQFALDICDGILVPKDFRGSPANVMSAISLAQRWNMDVWAVMEHMAIIHGKRMIDGQLAGALINTLGNIQHPLEYTYTGEGDDRTVVASATFSGQSNPREVAIRLGDVRTEIVQWKKQPDQQLAYTANRVWGRRYTPQLFLGVVFRGEPIELDQKDYSELPAINAPATPPGETINAETGEVTTNASAPHAVPKADDESWMVWGRKFIAFVKTETTEPPVALWREANDAALKKFEAEDARLYQGLMTRIYEHIAKIKNKEEKPDGE